MGGCGLGDSHGPGSTAAAVGLDAGVCLRDQLAEAIASLRWQTAVMLQAPDRMRGAGATGESESSAGGPYGTA